MTDQLDLWTPPTERVTKYQPHSATSKAAAQRVEPEAGTLRWAVLAFLRHCAGHGATDIEMQAALDMPGSTQRPRRVELFEAGLIRNSGLTRATPSGRQATVWKVT